MILLTNSELFWRQSKQGLEELSTGRVSARMGHSNSSELTRELWVTPGNTETNLVLAIKVLRLAPHDIGGD